MQLSLNLLDDPPCPEQATWEQLSEEERQDTAAQLAGMILGAALGKVDEENDDA